MPDSVITFLDRVTASTTYGQAAMYTPWVEVPDRCKSVEFRVQCHGWNNGDLEVAFETSMDQTSTYEMYANVVNSVDTTQHVRSSGIGRYMRVRVKSQTVGQQPNMVLSAFALFRTAA
jgi:hypothetical protein